MSVVMKSRYAMTCHRLLGVGGWINDYNMKDLTL